MKTAKGKKTTFFFLLLGWFSVLFFFPCYLLPGMVAIRIHFLMQTEKSCFLTLPCNSSFISNKRSWKKHLERSPVWGLESRHLFPFHQQCWDNLQNTTVVKCSTSGSIKMVSDFQIRTKYWFKNMEKSMFPKADLVCFLSVYHPITSPPVSCKTQGVSHSCHFSASHFCLRGWDCRLRMKLSGICQKCLNEMLGAWRVFTLHK